MEDSSLSQFQINNENCCSQIVEEMRKTFESGITMDLQFRRKQLKNLRRLFVEGEAEMHEAQFKDLHKNKYQTTLEDTVVIAEIDSMLAKLKEYTGNERLPFNVITALDDGYVRKEPLGLVLIIGTWNLPFQTSLLPLVGAIAAGNCAIVKPSECAPFCLDLMAKLIPQYLDQKCYKIVEGDAEVCKLLLKNRFDHIFFTGSQTVGRYIFKAAAPFLTPLTLELGGLNPCFIDESANYKKAAKKILWGKLLINGQFCVSPGYVMCTKQIQNEIVKHTKIFLEEFYGENLRESPDLSRIINKNHFNRLKKLLETTKGEIAIGGKMDEDNLWIEPTIVVNVCPDKDALMQEEIFGPILPIIVVSDLDEAIRIVRSKPKPLSSYIFSNNNNVTNRFIESTSSGNSCINDVVWQSCRPGLPFGGVGDSGIGSYHGKATFDTFTHKRAILKVSQDYLTEWVYNVRYAPNTNLKLWIFTFLGIHYEMLNLPIGRIFSHVLAALIGTVFIHIIYLLFLA